jgi:hypothetical protein
MNFRSMLIVALVLSGCSMPGQKTKEIDYTRLSYQYVQTSGIPAMLCLEDMQGC